MLGDGLQVQQHLPDYGGTSAPATTITAPAVSHQSKAATWF